MVDYTGKVYLVGSGPGDATYLTLQAQQVLAQAEVLVYDALVDGNLIDQVSDRCLKLDVGKRGGQPSTPQSEINRLLVEHCQQGKIVVRLKNGDPFIFGRAQSEIGALKRHHCEFEVVPGLSAALVAPLLAGIPLTDAQLSQNFTVVTAHNPDALNWVALAQLDTLVFLMGGRTLPELVRRLRGHGRSSSTPICIIRFAGRSTQQIWDGTLNTILDKTAGESLSPCIIVVGEVVKLRTYVGEQSRSQKAEGRRQDDSSRDGSSLAVKGLEELGVRSQAVQNASQQESEISPEAWTSPPSPSSPPSPPSPSSPLPLSAKTILVTRAATQSRQFVDVLQAKGARTIELPTLEIVPPSNWRDLDRAIVQIDDFDWLILTSTNGVDAFFQRLEAVTGEGTLYSNIKIAVVGEKTAQRLTQLGVRPDFVPPNFVADSLVAHFPEPLTGLRILFPRVESGGRETLVKEFTAQGANVREVAAYESRCPAAIDPMALKALQTGVVDVVTFASSKTVRHFCQLLQPIDPNWQRWLEGVAVASIGPQTSNACQEWLGRVDIEASEYTLDGLMQAIVTWATAPVLLQTSPPAMIEAAPSPTLEVELELQPTAIAEETSTSTIESDRPASTQTTWEVPPAPTASPTQSASSNQPQNPPTSTDSSPAQAQPETERSLPLMHELIQAELVADSEDFPNLDTVQVELDTPAKEILTAEAELLAEIQAVIEQGSQEEPDPWGQ